VCLVTRRGRKARRTARAGDHGWGIAGDHGGPPGTTGDHRGPGVTVADAGNSRYQPRPRATPVVTQPRGAGLRRFGEAEGRTLRRLPCGRGCVGARDVDAGPREDRPPGCAGGSGNRPEMILQCMRIWQCMRMHARSDLPHTRAKRSHVGKPPGEGPTCGHHRHGHTSRTASALAPIRRGRHLCRPMQARTPARRARKPWPDTLYVGHVEVCHVDKDISESLSQKTCKQKARRRVSRRA
jgi:hypothetical protein